MQQLNTSSTTNNPAMIMNKDGKGTICEGDGKRVVCRNFENATDIIVDDPESQANLQDTAFPFKGVEFYHAYEGTIIRLYFHQDKWCLATNKRVDAFTSRWAVQRSHGDLFLDALGQYYHNADESNVLQQLTSELDTDTQYMFLLGNINENVVVARTEEPIYCIGSFKDDKFIYPHDIGFIKSPEPVVGLHTWEDIFRYVNGLNFLCFQGVIAIIPRGEDRQPLHLKLVNQDYFQLQKIRGNVPNLEFRYLEIRMDRDKYNAFRGLYSEYLDVFQDQENTLFDIAQEIYKSYNRRYRHKEYVNENGLFVTVMKAAHSWHMSDPANNKVRLTTIIEHLNKVSPPRLHRAIKINAANSKLGNSVKTEGGGINESTLPTQINEGEEQVSDLRQEQLPATPTS